MADKELDPSQAYKNDPDYVATQDKLKSVGKNQALWSAIGVAAVLGAAASVVFDVMSLGLTIPVTIALGAVATYAMYKTVKDGNQIKDLQEESVARRGAFYARQRTPQQDIYADMGTGTQFQDSVGASRGQKAAGRG